MSISTEISRLEEAKTAISAAITNKGVEVPSGTKLDGMAALIEAIEGGSGNSGSYQYGVFQVGASGTSYTIEHGFGAVPSFIAVVMMNTTVQGVSGSSSAGLQFAYVSPTYIKYVTQSSVSGAQTIDWTTWYPTYTPAKYCVGGVTSTVFRIGQTSSSVTRLVAGQKYLWIVG